METYTREQIERGEGLFASGRHTVIWRTPAGRYATTEATGEKVIGGEIVGGGRLLADGTPRVQWIG